MSEILDKVFKLTSGEDERGLFWLVTGLRIPSSVPIRKVAREMVRPKMHMDECYEVLRGKWRGIYIFEATTRFRREVYERCGRYGFEKVLERWKAVYPYLFLLTKEGFPAEPPLPVGGRFGAATVSIHPVMVPLWKRKAELILEIDRPRLLPWVMLMDSTVEEQREAARRVLVQKDAELAGRMAALAGLRYGKGIELMERMNDMLLTEEILKESSFYKLISRKAKKEGRSEGFAAGRAEGLEEGVEKGVEQGLEKGLIEGERTLLQHLLNTRFGPIPASAARKIKKADRATIARWATQVLTAKNLTDALH